MNATAVRDMPTPKSFSIGQRVKVQPIGSTGLLYGIYEGGTVSRFPHKPMCAVTVDKQYRVGPHDDGLRNAMQENVWPASILTETYTSIGAWENAAYTKHCRVIRAVTWPQGDGHGHYVATDRESGLHRGSYNYGTGPDGEKHDSGTLILEY